VPIPVVAKGSATANSALCALYERVLSGGVKHPASVAPETSAAESFLSAVLISEMMRPEALAR